MIKVDQRLYKTSVFVAKLLITGLIFQALIFLNPDTTQIQQAFAVFMASLFNMAGLEMTQTGIRILSDEAVYVIVQDCLGWKSKAVFLGLMYASTQRFLENIKFIATGLVVLAVTNIVRVFTTVYLAEMNIISFDVIHGVLWRWSLTIVVLGLWFYWLRKKNRGTSLKSKLKLRIDEFKI